ncbi:e43af2fc-7c1c-4193-b2a5-b2f592e71348-CDS [Sclerotinia trifoliorum]|uniref:E43af2fc-7c1c-4193-b2a5-b2f592e71348-CDS n=1 Tax=Sclerotinia trifoliorum TaxID=28548 RepID=A0A8H2ZP37_9HELO|nr:e43af2fc-7c1c-4193-b2a5-b2f592e71348-CDS [Sclerotinia trifoliorum]
MDSPRILKTRSNIYQIAKKNQHSRPTSTSTRSNKGNSRPKPIPLENFEAVNKLPCDSALFSPASSVDSVSASNSEFEDSEEELVEVPFHAQSNTKSLDFYNNKMKDLAKTHKEIIDRRSPMAAEQTLLCPSRRNPSPSSSSILPSTEKSNRRSREDINDANLLLLLMVE